MNKNSLPKTWEAPHTHLEELLNNPWFRFLAKAYDLIHRETTAFFHEQKMSALMLPVTTGSISSPMGLGSDSEPISIEMFGHQVYLADSMQFLLELGLRLRPDVQGVWYIMPSFRGEEPDRRHLNEFIHLESEIKGDLEDIVSLVNSLICRLSCSFLNEMADDVQGIAGTLDHLESAARGTYPPRVHYLEAVQLLSKDPGAVVMHSAGFSEITHYGEMKLMELCGGPVWLTHHPMLRTPFYQRDDPDKGVALCADLLLGIGETVGAGARQVTADDLVEGLKRREVNIEPYQWYIEMKRLSPIPTAGFGMGLERFISWICQVDDIRHMQLVIRQRGISAVP